MHHMNRARSAAEMGGIEATATGRGSPDVPGRTQILVGRGGGANVSGSPRLVVLGELRVSHCLQFACALDRLGRLAGSVATVDLTGVPTIDATAQVVLTQHARQFARDGRRMRIVPPSWGAGRER